MIAIRKGNEITYYKDDGETELLRVRLPEGCRFTLDDVERFVEQIKKVVLEHETGSN